MTDFSQRLNHLLPYRRLIRKRVLTLITYLCSVKEQTLNRIFYWGVSSSRQSRYADPAGWVLSVLLEQFQIHKAMPDNLPLYCNALNTMGEDTLGTATAGKKIQYDDVDTKDNWNLTNTFQ